MHVGSSVGLHSPSTHFSSSCLNGLSSLNNTLSSSQVILTVAPSEKGAVPSIVPLVIVGLVVQPESEGNR